MNYKEVDGEILPSYSPDGNGNQPYYPKPDTEMPDSFHGESAEVADSAEVIDLTARRTAGEVADSKARHPGLPDQLPGIDMTDTQSTMPIGSVDEKSSARGRHPTAFVPEPKEEAGGDNPRKRKKVVELPGQRNNGRTNGPGTPTRAEIQKGLSFEEIRRRDRNNKAGAALAREAIKNALSTEEE